MLFAVANSTLSPVVLLPGLAGSRFQAQLNHTVEPHFFCEKSTKPGEWLQLWLALDELDLN